jgi:hypothetical protein
MKHYYGDRWLSFTKTDVYGGYELRVAATFELEHKLNWLDAFMKQEEEAKRIRESDPNVRAAWEQYRMALAMVKE